MFGPSSRSEGVSPRGPPTGLKTIPPGVGAYEWIIPADLDWKTSGSHTWSSPCLSALCFLRARLPEFRSHFSQPPACPQPSCWQLLFVSEVQQPSLQENWAIRKAAAWFFFLTFYFVLECSWLTKSWQSQVDSKETRSYRYLNPLSPTFPSRPGSHTTLSRVPWARQ